MAVEVLCLSCMGPVVGEIRGVVLSTRTMLKYRRSRSAWVNGKSNGKGNRKFGRKEWVA